jgi:choline kinase
MDSIKLSLGMPVYDSVKIETMMCTMLAVRELDCEIHLNFRKGLYIHDNRNEIVRAAQKVGATHLMFIDSDMTFYPDSIKRLLAHDKDIVGVLYNTKQTPSYSTIKMVDENGDFISMPGEKIPNELFPCFSVGSGFMLIKMHVFDKIKKPYFEFGDYKGQLMGEDVMFCKKANEVGFTIWCDPTIRMGHIGEYLY